MSAFRQLALQAARDVNSVLGDSVTYTEYDGTTIPSINVTIEHGNPVRDGLDNIVAYEVTATILKEDLDHTPYDDETITLADGTQYRVSGLRSETSAKWVIGLIPL